MLGLTAAFATALPDVKADVRSSGQESSAQAPIVQASFADKQSIAPDEPFELTIDRPLAAGEGRLAVLVGATDMTDLFVVSAQSLKYDAGKSFPLPPGATELTVYLVPPNNDWKEVARFPMRVGENAAPGTEGVQAKTEEPEAKTESQLATGASAQQDPTPEQASQQSPQGAEPQATGVSRFHPHRRRIRSAGRDPRSGEHRPIIYGRMAGQGDQAGLSFESFAAGQSRLGARTRRSAELHAQRDGRVESACDA